MLIMHIILFPPKLVSEIVNCYKIHIDPEMIQKLITLA